MQRLIILAGLLFLFFNSTAQQKVSLWRIDAQGNVVTSAEHGPFDDWKPLFFKENRLIWQYKNEKISFWIMDDNCQRVASVEHGIENGWSVLDYSSNKLLWQHTDGRKSLWWMNEDGTSNFKCELTEPAGGKFEGFDNGKLYYRINSQGSAYTFTNCDDIRLFSGSRLILPDCFFINESSGNKVFVAQVRSDSSYKEYRLYINQNRPVLFSAENKALGYQNDKILFTTPEGGINLFLLNQDGNKIAEKQHGPFSTWEPISFSGDFILWRSK